MREQDYLFNEGDLRDTLVLHGTKIEGIVDSIQKDQLLCTPMDDLVENIVSQLYIEPLTIYEDRMVRDQQEIKVDVSGSPGRVFFGDGPALVPGIQVVVSLPFTGESNLWQIGTNVFGPIPPYGIVKGSNLEMVFKCPTDRPLEGIKRELDENLGRIRENISRQDNSIVQFNKSLSGRIRAVIEDRKQRLAKHDKLADILNIPLRRSPNAPEIQPIPIQRRIIKPLPAPPTGGYKPEPGITEQEYEHILNIIRHEGRTFEGTPKTYAVHDEEDLRNILLAHLNGHYMGDATGETFRHSGKTDIRIEADNRAAFVAECKLWKGPKSVTDSIDQLLSYLIWRDCRTAIIIFNKEVAGFTDILGKIKPALESHPRFMKFVNGNEQGEWHYILRSKEDDERLVYLHVFLFNLYAPMK